ncbi:MAG: 2Fe-2S iron-sulfur cluster binding domain-containing protein [Pseudomonadales bacterium]|nr:2Fe-2S iron-sulfur cluster binding domain-containing protein [Pseudomonadales bacterium]MCP5182546.1 2Fe-2S iron-sulfur cluster binding domain-containing protein [Pseudomonadales bacterium]
MPKIVYVEHNGTAHEVDVAVGESLMQAAVNHAIPGIDGDCGGLCACGTCHVYVPAAFAALTGTPDELEQGMLEFAFDTNETSRLSCQIKATEAMEGMRLQLPARQY